MLPGEDVAPPDPAAQPPSAEAALLQGERCLAVERAIRRLPDDHREVIELRHFQDLSYEELAGVLGCPTGTVMSRLYRARKALRAELLAEPACAPAEDGVLEPPGRSR